MLWEPSGSPSWVNQVREEGWRSLRCRQEQVGASKFELNGVRRALEYLSQEGDEPEGDTRAVNSDSSRQ